MHHPNIVNIDRCTLCIDVKIGEFFRSIVGNGEVTENIVTESSEEEEEELRSITIMNVVGDLLNMEDNYSDEDDADMFRNTILSIRKSIIRSVGRDLDISDGKHVDVNMEARNTMKNIRESIVRKIVGDQDITEDDKDDKATEKDDAELEEVRTTIKYIRESIVRNIIGYVVLDKEFNGQDNTEDDMDLNITQRFIRSVIGDIENMEDAVTKYDDKYDTKEIRRTIMNTRQSIVRKIIGDMDDTEDNKGSKEDDDYDMEKAANTIMSIRDSIVKEIIRDIENPGDKKTIKEIVEEKEVNLLPVRSTMRNIRNSIVNRMIADMQNTKNKNGEKEEVPPVQNNLRLDVEKAEERRRRKKYSAQDDDKTPTNPVILKNTKDIGQPIVKIVIDEAKSEDEEARDMEVEIELEIEIDEARRGQLSPGASRVVLSPGTNLELEISVAAPVTRLLVLSSTGPAAVYRGSLLGVYTRHGDHNNR